MIVIKLLFSILIGFSVCVAQPFIRLNQLGYLPKEIKIAIVLSNENINNVEFTIVDRNSKQFITNGPLWLMSRTYGSFKYVYQANFTALRSEGNYAMTIGESDSAFIRISKNVYQDYLNSPMHYLLEQHCGYNSIFDTLCHQFDAIAVDGPDAGKRFEMTGGYHDASDYIRNLSITSYTTGILLMTFKDYSGLWIDLQDERGKYKSNKIPDLLDEVRWGLEWMLKLYPERGKLYHQIGDDRGCASRVLPFRDTSNYGWGKGNGRPAYFATGISQGLSLNKNSTTGIANIAGRMSAVFALASWTWRKERYDIAFSEKLLEQAIELYDIAKNNLGSTKSVPFTESCRLYENTYYDDLEWAATELYRITGKKTYLNDAIDFATKIADESWMGRDTTHRYEYFPFVNLGHYELFNFVGTDIQAKLKNYYRSGLNKAQKKTGKNVFNYGVPFIECSNNLGASLVLQAILYKKMSGSGEFDDLLRDARDWLFGKNPWGQSFIIGIPDSGNYPKNPYSVVSTELKITLDGALVCGPISDMIYKNLFKNQLSNEDEFAKFQTDICVYHDDSGDYLTNEPTLDGTATLLYILTHYSRNEQVDSDKDGFSDDDEVLKYKTNPFNSDTDADGLTDSEEVLRYHTDPLIADLDRDSLSDGSIINKSTNPVNQNDPKKVLPNNETPKAEPLQAEVGKAIVLSGIVFKSGKAIIEKDTADMLARAFRMLIENKEIKVEIYGYTDNFGNEKTNMKLSQDRADAVKAWLVKNGINAERIKAIGLGSSNPIASNTTKEGRAKNHRIEFVRSK